ncbi:hypothetical protein BKM78_06620 [Tessaracoccus sp. T2.5-30]|nr:hypothetical protein BKM78_06620 [Tessaracoccus sp. T2.5-30]
MGAAAGCGPDDLRLIVLTHGDVDHAGNCAHLRSTHHAPIAIHRHDAEMVRSGDMTAGRTDKPDRHTLAFRFLTWASQHPTRLVLRRPHPGLLARTPRFGPRTVHPRRDALPGRGSHQPHGARGMAPLHTARLPRPHPRPTPSLRRETPTLAPTRSPHPPRGWGGAAPAPLR